MNVNLNDLLNEAAGGQPAVEETKTEEQPKTEETKTEEQPAEEQPKTEETKVEEQPKTESKEQPKTEEKKNPIKEVRDQLNETKRVKEFIEHTMQRFTDGDYAFKFKDFKTEDGKVDYEALSKAMDEEDNKRKAESKGITPEIQAELDRIEKEKLELNKARIKVAMDRSLADLQIAKNLNKEDINNFFKDALALNKNPYQWLAQGGSLEDLYYLIYRDKLTTSAIDDAVAKAKAEWEQKSKVVPPISNPAKQTTQTNLNGISLAELKAEASK